MGKLKQCTKCGNNKRSSSFYKDRSKKDGMTCWCKKCCAEHSKQKNEAALPFVYRLVFADGSVYYGSSNGHPNKRKTDHFSDMKCGRHKNANVQQKFVTYGLPDFQILILCDSIGEAIENERILTDAAEDKGICCLNMRHGENRNDQRKLSAEDVIDIYLSKLTQRELARRYGVDRLVVTSIKNRKCYKEITAGLGTAGRSDRKYKKHKKYVRLTAPMKKEILASNETGAALAKKFGCTDEAINAFRRRNR